MAGVRPTHRNVDNIKSTILQPSLTPYFEVQIPVPSFLSSLNGGTSSPYNYLSILCTEASLPGNQLITFNVDNDYTGVTEKMPHRKVYDQKLDLTFYVNVGDENYYPIRFFESYISYIAGEDQNAGDFGLRDSNYFYKMSYPDDYMLDKLYIYKFEKESTSGLTYEFIRTYPTNINTMPITYGDAQVLKCTVSYSYVRYVMNQKFNTKRKYDTRMGLEDLDAFNNSGIVLEPQYSAQEVEAMNAPNPVAPEPRILRGQGNRRILSNPNRRGGQSR